MALLMIVAIGLASTSAVLRWQTEIQRERERQLRFAGEQYAAAIASYFMAVPAAKQYPLSIDDLLDDKRFPAPRRHLRRKYPDPMTGRTDWVLILQDGRIIGLHSRSAAPTLRQERGAQAAATYADWLFMAAVGAAGQVETGTATNPVTPGDTVPTTPVPTPQPPVIYNPVQSSPDETPSCFVQYQDAVRACTNAGGNLQQFNQCRAQALQVLRVCRQANGN